jgi:hypothetical protein
MCEGHSLSNPTHSLSPKSHLHVAMPTHCVDRVAEVVMQHVTAWMEPRCKPYPMRGAPAHYMDAHPLSLTRTPSSFSCTNRRGRAPRA